MLDRDVDAARLGADGPHRLAVADEIEQPLRHRRTAAPQEEPFGLELAPGIRLETNG